MGRCDKCGKKCRDYGMVVLEKGLGEASENICGDCYNERISEEYDIEDFKDFIHEVTYTDCDGELHHFLISKMIFPGAGVEWHATELLDNDIVGYSFEVIQKFDDDPRRAVAAIHEKVKRGLAHKFIKKKVNHGKAFLCLCNNTAEGRVESDNKRNIPRFVIDGKEYTYEQLGEILLTYEGWNFKLEIKEPSK
jgi:hypothetical protein